MQYRHKANLCSPQSISRFVGNRRPALSECHNTDWGLGAYWNKRVTNRKPTPMRDMRKFFKGKTIFPSLPIVTRQACTGRVIIGLNAAGMSRCNGPLLLLPTLHPLLTPTAPSLFCNATHGSSNKGPGRTNTQGYWDKRIPAPHVTRA